MSLPKSARDLIDQKKKNAFLLFILNEQYEKNKPIAIYEYEYVKTLYFILSDKFMYFNHLLQYLFPISNNFTVKTRPFYFHCTSSLRCIKTDKQHRITSKKKQKKKQKAKKEKKRSNHTITLSNRIVHVSGESVCVAGACVSSW